MGYICLPWRRQPTGAARINWRNPITRGLIMAVVGKTGKDLVSGSLGYGANASAIDVALAGTTIDTMGVNSPTNLTHGAPFYGRAGGIPSDPGQFTFLQWRKHLSTGNYGTSNIGGWVNSGGDKAFLLGLQYSSANFYPGVGNTRLSTGISLKDDLWHMLSVSLGGGTARAWIDGVNRTSGAAVAPTFNFTFSYDIFQLPSSPLSLLFERELSAAEQLSLYRDPWQVIEPEWVWVPVSAPSAPDLVGVAGSQKNAAATGAVVQTHVLLGSLSSQANTAPAGVLGGTHALVGVALAQGNRAQTGAAAQVHVLASAASSQINVGSDAGLGEVPAIVLAGAPAAQANAATGGAVTQVHALLAPPSVQDQVAHASAVVQAHVLQGSASRQGNAGSAGTIPVSGTGTLTPETIAAIADAVWARLLGDASAGRLLAELHQIHGLRPGVPLAVGETTRTAGDIVQAIGTSGATTTVTRQ